MAKSEKTVTVSTRVAPRDRALIGALVAAEGDTVCETLHRLLMPAVRRRLAEIAAETDDFEGSGRPEKLGIPRSSGVS
ncbi:MAG: hypothetical protein H0X65_17530 [Gemmatimonadetes bacterium]|nr:hypothetical protein [Gemmatimonadota bacterium]